MSFERMARPNAPHCQCGFVRAAHPYVHGIGTHHRHLRTQHAGAGVRNGSRKRVKVGVFKVAERQMLYGSLAAASLEAPQGAKGEVVCKTQVGVLVAKRPKGEGQQTRINAAVLTRSKAERGEAKTGEGGSDFLTPKGKFCTEAWPSGLRQQS